MNEVWFFLIVFLIAGYSVLDGFDLGVGILYPFVKKEADKRICLKAIGPFWDGNEVWLVTAVGALFAAFPKVYATLFSGFYPLFIAILFGLIFRAIALEFRGKLDSPSWKLLWDRCFSIGSLVIAFLLGMITGNLSLGVHQAPLLGELFHPYAFLTGLTAVLIFALHGASFLTLKTVGTLQGRVRRVAGSLWFLVVVFCVLSVLAVGSRNPGEKPLFFWPLLFVALGSALCLPIFLRYTKDFSAFLASSVLLVALVGAGAFSVYPNWFYYRSGPLSGLSIYDSASSPETLKVMLIVALIGMPLVLAYTAVVYWIFRGKVEGEQFSSWSINE